VCKEHFVNFSPQYSSSSFTIDRRRPVQRISSGPFFALDKLVFVGYTANNILYKGYDCEGVTGRMRKRPAFPKENCRVVRGSRNSPRIHATSRRLNETQNLFSRISVGFAGTPAVTLGQGIDTVAESFRRPYPLRPSPARARQTEVVPRTQSSSGRTGGGFFFYKIPLCLNRQRGFFMVTHRKRKREEKRRNSGHG